MVNQPQATSDSPTFVDSTKQTKHGSFPTSVSDAPNFADVLAESKIPVGAVIDPIFAHLNGRNIRRSNVGRSPIREKMAIINVTFASNLAYVQGGIVMDFLNIAGMEKMTQVYLCSPTHLSTPFYVLFVPDTNNVSNLGKLKFFDMTGAELAQGSNKVEGLTFKCYIRGV